MARGDGRGARGVAMRTFGLIPAAGLSQRMGRPKLLLPIGGRTVLEFVISALQTAHVDEIIVVSGPGGEAIAQLATTAGAHAVQLAEQTPDMRATCLAGLNWIEARFQPAPQDAWLLLPADHPTVRADVVFALMNAAARATQSIFLPVHGGRRGHPTLFGWKHVSAIRAQPPDVGINAYIRKNAHEVHELEWSSDEVTRDLDTPADYERLR